MDSGISRETARAFRDIVYRKAGLSPSVDPNAGWLRLGIVHERTVPYSPYQNGQQESWWNQMEGRLLPMLEGMVDFPLAALNEATLAWMEMDSNRKPHSELGKSPWDVYLHARDAGRPRPSTQALQEAFTLRSVRTQRRSDGTLSLVGHRFELPSRYAHFQRVSLRYASWDLVRVYLADPHSGNLRERIDPLDKSQNEGGLRALRASASPRSVAAAKPLGTTPLLQNPCNNTPPPACRRPICQRRCKSGGKAAV